jgi:uncharacterized protein YaeQ
MIAHRKEFRVAQGATIYTVEIELADVDRGVYTTLDLRVARHPAESADFLVTRILAYCCEYTEGIAFTQGIGAGDEPAIWVRDLTGRVVTWIEVGLPDAERLHRGRKQSDHAVVYTHRDAAQLVTQLRGKKIYQAATIPIYALERRFVAGLAERLERRSSLSLSITEGQLFVALGAYSTNSKLASYRLE